LGKNYQQEREHVKIATRSATLSLSLQTFLTNPLGVTFEMPLVITFGGLENKKIITWCENVVLTNCFPNSFFDNLSMMHMTTMI